MGTLTNYTPYSKYNKYISQSTRLVQETLTKTIMQITNYILILLSATIVSARTTRRRFSNFQSLRSRHAPDHTVITDRAFVDAMMRYRELDFERRMLEIQLNSEMNHHERPANRRRRRLRGRPYYRMPRGKRNIDDESFEEELRIVNNKVKVGGFMCQEKYAMRIANLMQEVEYAESEGDSEESDILLDKIDIIAETACTPIKRRKTRRN